MDVLVAQRRLKVSNNKTVEVGESFDQKILGDKWELHTQVLLEKGYVILEKKKGRPSKKDNTEGDDE